MKQPKGVVGLDWVFFNKIELLLVIGFNVEGAREYKHVSDVIIKKIDKKNTKSEISYWCVRHIVVGREAVANLRQLAPLSICKSREDVVTQLSAY